MKSKDIEKKETNSISELLNYFKVPISIATAFMVGAFGLYLLKTFRVITPKSDEIEIIQKLEQVAELLPSYLDEQTYLRQPITIQGSIEEAKKDMEKLGAGKDLVRYDFEILDAIRENKYTNVPTDLVNEIESFYERYEEFRKRRDKFAYQDLYSDSLSTPEMHSEAMRLDRGGDVWLRVGQFRKENKAELLGLLQEKINLEQKLLEKNAP